MSHPTKYVTLLHLPHTYFGWAWTIQINGYPVASTPCLDEAETIIKQYVRDGGVFLPQAVAA